jgi:hypothetical protein
MAFRKKWGAATGTANKWSETSHFLTTKFIFYKKYTMFRQVLDKYHKLMKRLTRNENNLVLKSRPNLSLLRKDYILINNIFSIKDIKIIHKMWETSQCEKGHQYTKMICNITLETTNWSKNHICTSDIMFEEQNNAQNNFDFISEIQLFLENYGISAKGGEMSFSLRILNPNKQFIRDLSNKTCMDQEIISKIIKNNTIMEDGFDVLFRKDYIILNNINSLMYVKMIYKLWHILGCEKPDAHSEIMCSVTNRITGTDSTFICATDRIHRDRKSDMNTSNRDTFNFMAKIPLFLKNNGILRRKGKTIFILKIFNPNPKLISILGKNDNSRNSH